MRISTHPLPGILDACRTAACEDRQFSPVSPHFSNDRRDPGRLIDKICHPSADLRANS
jgi:hypothetical protein